MIDVDFFKRINDSFGHPAGDQVLVAVSKLLQTRVRPNDIVGRFGGEEFIVVCPDTSEHEALHLANRLCEEVRRLISTGSEPESWPVTISIGIFTCRPVGMEKITDFILLKADQALYKAKNTGRDRACIYTENERSLKLSERCV